MSLSLHGIAEAARFGAQFGEVRADRTAAREARVAVEPASEGADVGGGRAEAVRLASARRFGRSGRQIEGRVFANFFEIELRHVEFATQRFLHLVALVVLSFVHHSDQREIYPERRI